MHAQISLPLATLIVFGSAKLMAELFERLRLPGMAGEILAGVLIGPSVLGWIIPTDALKALSDLGVMFLLFGIGLEVKVADLFRVSGVSAIVATLGEAIPFLTGWLFLLAWGAGRDEALFVGVSIVATSVGITASVLAARGLLRQSASKVILAAAVIDDILGLIALAIVSGVAGGHLNIEGIAVTAALASGFTVVTAVWGTKFVAGWFPHFHSRARAGEAKFHVSMALLFALAVLAVYAGVAAIVGAFLAGLALAESADQHVRDLTRGVSELLVPFFLVGVGLNFNVAIFHSASSLILPVALFVAALLAKLIGCAVGALPLGWSTAWRVAFGMAPRGEVAIIAAQLGLSMSVLSPDLYSTIVFVVVATALVTPLLLGIAFPHKLAAK